MAKTTTKTSGNTTLNTVEFAKKLPKSIHKINSNVTKAYFGFLFQTFLKRPFGYIIALLYIFYLSVILMIVPAAMEKGPLFIWTLGGFNMAMFNLFFIAAMASAIAVVLFKVGVEDGTELSLSAKPITKARRVWIKTAAYVIIMLAINILCVCLVSLVKPIFGEWSIMNPIQGITNKEYGGLLLSIFVGNLVCMLLFGGIGIFISLVGGQVITMIGSIGIAFLMCLLNFIYPLAAGTPKKVIKDVYNTQINSISAVTKSQLHATNGNTDLQSFAAIQCITEESGVEPLHYDTYEYWTKANKESGTFVTNYLDFGKQLSSLFTGFGLDDNKLKEAARLSIGTNLSYKYIIDKNTHVDDQNNVKAEEYPVALYSIYSKQGVSYPTVNILGGNTGLDVDNWWALSKLMQVDFNSLSVLSASPQIPLLDPVLLANGEKTYFTLFDLNLGKDAQQKQKEKTAAEALLSKYFNKIKGGWDRKDYSKSADESENSAIYMIMNDESGAYFKKGTWDTLTTLEKTRIISQIQIYWMDKVQDIQKGWIEDYRTNSLDPFIQADVFPYSSYTIMHWYADTIKDQSGTIKSVEKNAQQELMERIFTFGIWSGSYELKGDNVSYYSYPVNSALEYCETFNNVYKYNVKSYFNVYALTAIWTSVALTLFAVSIVIYKKTDFK